MDRPVIVAREVISENRAIDWASGGGLDREFHSYGKSET